jgi:hypothetical protein
LTPEEQVRHDAKEKLRLAAKAKEEAIEGNFNTGLMRIIY